MNVEKSFKKLITVNIFICSILVSATCLSQNGRLVGTEKLGDARMLAMGGALRASSSNTSAVYLNPAAMGMAKVYHLNVKYQYTGLDQLHNGGIVLMDSVTHRIFSGGVSLDYLRSSKDETDFKSWDGRLAGSLNIQDVFFIGITGRYLKTSHDVESSSRGPNVLPAFPRNDTVQASGVTMDAGLAAKAGDMVTLGLVAYNITDTGTVYAPFQLGGGVGLQIKNIWLIEVDAIADFSSYNDLAMEVQLGTEIILKRQFSLRGGYGREFHFKVNSYSLGFGYTASRFAIDLGFRQDIEYLKRFRIGLGFRIFIS